MQKTLRLLTTALLSAGVVATASAQLRPEVGRPLQQAGEMLKAGNARGALAKVREADAVGNKTAAEQTTIDRMRGAAAQRAGETGTAIAAFESLMSGGRVGGGEQAQIAETLAGLYVQQKNFGKANEWISRARQLGANAGRLAEMSAYIQSQSGDYNAILRDSTAAVQSAEGAGRKPGEDDLLRMADAAQRTNNNAAYSAALEKLVVYYAKKDYWSAHLARIQRKPGFSSRLGLDVMRLKLAQGLMASTEEYMEMAQLAVQAGLPAEGKAIVEKGYANGALGKGDQAERHGRLRDLVLKQDSEVKAGLAAATAEAEAKKDGNDLVKVGMVHVSLGQVDQGIALIEKGIARGQLRNLDDAKLRLGMAQLQSAKTKAKGIQTLRTVGGKDGTADVARLWAIQAG
jgi:hypothetical protein